MEKSKLTDYNVESPQNVNNIIKQNTGEMKPCL